MTISEAKDPIAWDSFLASQTYRPFLQTWAMGEVYAGIGQEPIRLEARENGVLSGICFAQLVNAKRGRHLAVPYGPVMGMKNSELRMKNSIDALLLELQRIAKDAGCSFIRMSPFWVKESSPILNSQFSILNSPLHLLAEHIWYLPLTQTDQWMTTTSNAPEQRSEEDIFKAMRSTTRNLVRRAQKEGVTIEASSQPNKDIEHFLRLHDETRQRHGFTAYTDSFFRAQVKNFTNPTPDTQPPTPSCTLYLAHYQGKVIASSIHMHFAGETSYHHGASTYEFRNIPASYLLQWTAITDALKRGDHVYNFWGIAPVRREDQKYEILNQKHPFAGVTLFKTGFGGNLLDLVHCMDIPISRTYYITRAFEYVRKWKRGF